MSTFRHLEHLLTIIRAGPEYSRSLKVYPFSLRPSRQRQKRTGNYRIKVFSMGISSMLPLVEK